MNIGEKIKKRRNELNLTQKELAETIGITEATLSRYENNQRIPNADILKKIAAALNTSMDYFADTPTPHPYKPELTEKDKKDIAKTIDEWLQDLTKADGLAFFNGEPVDDETKEYLKDSFEMILKHAKIINKKKYRK